MWRWFLCEVRVCGKVQTTIAMITVRLILEETVKKK